MILYHGTNQDFDTIDLSKGLPYKDFGRGFYLTPNKETAINMAIKRTKLFDGKALLIEYDFNEKGLQSNELNVLHFPEKATVEWAHFVQQNRNRQKPYTHEYDIVIGPIADDGVAYSLGRYYEGTMTLEELAESLQNKYFDQQYFFGTELSLQYLTKLNTIIL